MKLSVRNFRGFEDWVDFDPARITAVYGPNASGKSGLISAFLLMDAQRDLFRLSFAGGSHGIPGFLDAVRDRDPDRRLDFLLRVAVDAAAVMVPEGAARPEPVPYEFEIALSYAGDPFDGSASGLLAEASIVLVGEGERSELFSIRPMEDGIELYLGLDELLRLPFVHERAVHADEELVEDATLISRSAEMTAALARGSKGQAAERAKALQDSLEAARKEAAFAREFERIVLPEPAAERFAPRWLRTRDRSVRFVAGERKYLRALVDVFVAEAMAENGVRAFRSRASGREIRASFYAIFYDLLAAAGFLPSSKPPFLARFPAREAPRDGDGCDPSLAGSSASGARALVRVAEERWAAYLRDAIDILACRGPEGRCAIEGALLDASYGETAIAFRETRAGASLVPEGGARDPEVMDLEGRREELRSFLSRQGLADDIEFLPRSSEDRAICLVRSGRREMLGDRGWGIARLVLVAASLLYLPWGSRLVLEDPEAGLDERMQAAMADLLRLLVRRTGSSVLVETRSAAFLEALGFSVISAWSPEAASKGSSRSHEPESTAIGVCDSVDGMSRLIELGRNVLAY